jgi:hypothetical protein
VQIDEMWHFVNGKKTRWLLSGFGVVGPRLPTGAMNG